MNITPTTTPGCYDSVHNTTAKGLNWLSTNTKAFAASASETLSRIWAAISEFFSSIMSTLGSWLAIARDTVIAGKDQFMALPKEAKILAGLTLGLSVLVSVVATRCLCNGSTAVQNPSPAPGTANTATPQGPTPQTTQANPAQTTQAVPGTAPNPAVQVNVAPAAPGTTTATVRTGS